MRLFSGRSLSICPSLANEPRPSERKSQQADQALHPIRFCQVGSFEIVPSGFEGREKRFNLPALPVNLGGLCRIDFGGSQNQKWILRAGGIHVPVGNSLEDDTDLGGVPVAPTQGVFSVEPTLDTPPGGGTDLLLRENKR